MKIIPYIAVILLGISIFNVWFFLTTYRTARYWSRQTPKEVIVKEYVSKECECAECVCDDWTDFGATSGSK